jgi:hypothetical protein
MRPLRGLRLAHGALPLLLFLTLACSSSVAPQMKVFGPIDPSITRLLYVTTNAERESVLAALRQAGFSITSDARETTFQLVVRLGASRSSRTCGWIRNVVYELRQKEVRIALVKGRGWTGSCSPNILLDMSARLAALFGSSL